MTDMRTRSHQHGSRASTSSSGSADLLQSLGCLFTAPTPGTPLPIAKVPFTFILAPHYHPALAMIAPYRKSLPFRTMFNILGPLINPARPRGMVLGVAEPELGYIFALSLRNGGVERGSRGVRRRAARRDQLRWEHFRVGAQRRRNHRDDSSSGPIWAENARAI